MSSMYLYYIDVGYACFGIVALHNVVRDAPPIARWMIDANMSTIIQWVHKKKGKIIKLSKL